MFRLSFRFFDQNRESQRKGGIENDEQTTEYAQNGIVPIESRKVDHHEDKGGQNEDFDEKRNAENEALLFYEFIHSTSEAGWLNIDYKIKGIKHKERARG